MSNAQAQAMKEQAQLKEEMAYQYKIGNFEVNTLSYMLDVSYSSQPQKREKANQKKKKKDMVWFL